MKKICHLFLAFSTLTLSLSAQPMRDDSSSAWFKNTTEVIHSQLNKAAETYQPGKNPRSINPDGTIRLAGLTDWTTGFFPGTLWYGYELTGDKALAEKAKIFTLALDSIRNIKNTHDVGFMLFCSYGNAYRITGDRVYLPVLADGAANLYARFNPKVGTIRSWDWLHYPVIIDNMMNLEYLYWSANQFKNPKYAAAASTHALTTMKNHFRKDYSSYHVVDYDPQTGKVLRKMTHQGVTDDSAWARGQAWGLYGYTMCYANTKNPQFLKQAKNIASFIMNHPRMPKDKVPVWDFDVHNAMDTDVPAPRDASAAAVIASGLLDLSTQVKDGKIYFDYAEDILKSLSSDAYLAKPGENGYFILKHSVGAFLYNSEIDTPLDYADYYYLEALKRYASIKKI
ncbi:glycoside hydrolase family 88 protein [Flavobacterium sp. Fl-318]|jgi:unsaturated chondroitin disaccharide hydrolase|uniref:Glycoside hydrolase family 88 protein n=1 Tax=Flavobacterium cupriresistens TaxID=2893885 RepID=A0ABU4RH99_9FLAO|nr:MULTISPECIES: glycoside hydrolase family 88 protein [unclassified Flavobacterium]MDX6191932.1 glycoside hydrolase family 88 protein [Flavobacterium sp. Fl-318]UFH44571.1 glycoside hydrolase family 88 protein [Flavobacterium sp. F-323]